MDSAAVIGKLAFGFDGGLKLALCTDECQRPVGGKDSVDLLHIAYAGLEAPGLMDVILDGPPVLSERNSLPAIFRNTQA